MRRTPRNASQRAVGHCATEHMVSLHRRIDTISSFGFHAHDIVRDWIELMFCAYLSGGNPESPYEADYMRVLQRYQSKRKNAAEEFALMHGDLVRHMQSTNEEGLSGVWETYCANEATAQFFTPWHLCVAMAKMQQLDQVDFSQYSKERPLTFNDPACGGGLTLLAAAKEMQLADLYRCEFVGQDVDMNCCRMTALNMMFFNLRGLVIWGDTLRNEWRRAWRTNHSLVWGGSICEVEIVEAPKVAALPQEQPKTIAPPPPREPEAVMQGSLF